MITITATNMLFAQSYKLTDEHRAQLTASANRFREITGETGKVSQRIVVKDVYQPTVTIGYLDFLI